MAQQARLFFKRSDSGGCNLAGGSLGENTDNGEARRRAITMSRLMGQPWPALINWEKECKRKNHTRHYKHHPFIQTAPGAGLATSRATSSRDTSIVFVLPNNVPFRIV